MKVGQYAFVLWIGGACVGDLGPPPPTTAETGDTGETSTFTTPIGLGDVTIEINGAYVGGEAETRVLGVFTEPPTEIRNLAQCLGGQQFCMREDRPSMAGGSVDVEPFDPAILKTISTVAAGDPLSLGRWEAPLFVDTATGLALYSQVNEGTLTSEPPIDLTIPGGVGWPLTGAEGVVDLPDPVGLRLIDPMMEQDFVDIDGIPLRWLPGGPPPPDQASGDDGTASVGAPGEVFLLIETPNRRRLQRLADTGSFDLDLSGAGLTDGDRVELLLGRWTRGEVRQDGRTTVVTIQRNQRIRGVWRSVGVRQPLTPDDTCDEARDAAGIDDGFYEGTFDPPTSALDPGELGCTGRAAPGVDALVPIDVRAQSELTVRFALPDAEASLYLVTDCDDAGTCLVGTDETGPEALRWLNDSTDLVRVFAVLDSVGDASGDFTLDVRRRPVGGDVLVNTCLEAIEQGPIGSGTFEGTLLDHSNLLPTYTGVCAGDRLGGEGIAAVELAGGQSLTVDATGSTGTPDIHILSNCNIAASCVALGSETLTYTNETGFARTVYVVLDAEVGIDQYRLDVSF